MKRSRLLIALALGLAVLAGCATLDQKQREWIFQPSDRSWSGGDAAAAGMQDVWIDFRSDATGRDERLHALWAASDNPKAPVLLYLHGARWNVTGSAFRIRRMQELGFSVLGVEYRGFGKSSPGLPGEATASRWRPRTKAARPARRKKRPERERQNPRGLLCIVRSRPECRGRSP